MTLVFNRKRKILERRLAELYQELEAVYNQLGRILSDTDRLRIEREGEHIETAIEKIEVKLRELESVEGGRYRRYLNWQARLPEIDFKDAVDIFEYVHNQFRYDGGAATFLIQNSHVMGGRWCVARLKGLLKTADFRHYEIEFTPETQLSLPALLNRLGEYLGCDPYTPQTLDVQQYVQMVLDKLSASLQSGSIVFVELRVWDSVSLHDEFLPLFLQYFWDPLVESLPGIAARHPMISFITMIVVNVPLAVDCLPPALCCTKEDFSSKKILEIPLQKWTKEEITDWLYQFAGLTAPHIGLSPAQVRQIAQTVYWTSGQGQPALVYSVLNETLEQYFS